MSTTARVVKTPDVLHGKPRIEGTRIGVFTLGVAAERGASVAEILEDYPSLDRTQVETAIEYYETHPELMDTLRMQSEAARQAIEARSRSPK